MQIKRQKQVPFAGKLALVAGLILAVGVSSFAPFYAACSGVRRHTLRLHILANSDSAQDQALKLAVRDAVLQAEGEALGHAATKEEALAQAADRLPAIQALAQQVVHKQGYDYPVVVTLTEQYFPTRVYDDFTLPAGRYDAVRIEIGNHEGKNWFCVLFPPMCVPVGTAQDDTGENTFGYTQDEAAAVRSPYKVKFAAVEWLERLRNAA